jgi:predicted alpha/beta superfamily hydrolase
MRSLILLLCSLIVMGNTVSSQTVAGKHTGPFVLGQVHELASRQLGEKRKLNIYLPEGYKKDDTTRYPVLYMLDGSANEDFIHVTGVVQFLTMIQFMPPTIIVGIANVDRKRDFTHPATFGPDKELLPTSGGSAKFISFLEKEVQPYIDRQYKTGKVKTLLGQSLGGLLSTEVLLKKPSLFTDYIIVSPSLWWNNESLLLEADSLLRVNAAKDVRVYIAMGEEGKQMKDDAEQLADILGRHKWLNARYVPYPKETHLTILHRSVYDALEYFNHKP